MLLTGTFTRSIDEKLRLAIPKRLLKAAFTTPGGATLFAAPGTDGSLGLYTEDAFAQLAARLAQASPTGRDVRAFSRMFYGQAQALEVDAQGRVRIPPELAKLAGLGKEAVLVGVQDHLELWDRQRWETYLTEKQAHYDEIAEAALHPKS